LLFEFTPFIYDHNNTNHTKNYKDFD
jgi:hypothetical protein